MVEYDPFHNSQTQTHTILLGGEIRSKHESPGVLIDPPAVVPDSYSTVVAILLFDNIRTDPDFPAGGHGRNSILEKIGKHLFHLLFVRPQDDLIQMREIKVNCPGKMLIDLGHLFHDLTDIHLFQVGSGKTGKLPEFLEQLIKIVDFLDDR